jgi:predicted enzyme related to lactoylglutathione lyase
MPTRDRAPKGAPCWTDLWTSDVEGSRKFYSELFGWQAEEPSEEFGGYFMFTKNGKPVAGAMGDMPGMPAQNVWKVYLQTDDIAKTMEVAEQQGSQLLGPIMPIADLGIQSVFIDPTGAHLGAWQPGTFPGFTTLGEHGTPSWSELWTRDHAKSVEFYESVFGWETIAAGDTEDFRYTMLKNADGDGELAGIMDAAKFLPEGVPDNWSIYWEVDDAVATVAKVKELGGAVVADAEATPYGTMATVADPTGSVFKLRTQP